MHGPCQYDDFDNSYLHWCPQWPDLPAIRVVDTVARTLRPFQQSVWREARNKAIERWGISGLQLLAVERDQADYPEFDGANLEEMILPGRIRLVRNYTGTTYADFAWWSSTKQGSFACYTPGAIWWKQYYRPALAGIIGHEIGHCLGLAHGGGGIMSGNWRPNEHDLESVSAYYNVTGAAA